jgi:hypothetical protein
MPPLAGTDSPLFVRQSRSLCVQEPPRILQLLLELTRLALFGIEDQRFAIQHRKVVGSRGVDFYRQERRHRLGPLL